MDAFLINWMLPTLGGFLALMVAMQYGRIYERGKHNCPPCPRKHRDEL